jgi:hypothetical protein
MAEKKRPKTKNNPLLASLSIVKWEPDTDMIDSIDETIKRATVGKGQEVDQWHKDYRKAIG